MEQSRASRSADDFLGGLNLAQIVTFFRRHARLIATMTVIGFGVGIGAALVLPKEWQARGVLQIGQIARSARDSIEIVPVETTARAAERMRMAQFQDDVLRKLGLPLSRYESNSTGLIRDYAQVEVVRGTELIAVNARGYSEDDAKRFVQAYQTELIKSHEALLRPSLERGQAELAQAKASLAELDRRKAELERVASQRPDNAASRFSENVLLSRLVESNLSDIRDVRQRIGVLQENLNNERTFNTRPLMAEVEVRDRPVFPRKSVFAGIGLMIGFVLGCVISGMREAIVRGRA